MILSMIIKQKFTEPEIEVKWYYGVMQASKQADFISIENNTQTYTVYTVYTDIYRYYNCDSIEEIVIVYVRI